MKSDNFINGNGWNDQLDKNATFMDGNKIHPNLKGVIWILIINIYKKNKVVTSSFVNLSHFIQLSGLST